MHVKTQASSAQHFKELLHAHGFRATPSRLVILAAIAKAKKPLSINRILALVKRGSVDTATVYRMLADLTRANILREVDLRHGHAHYELADPLDHHHLVCTNCDRVENFNGCNIDKVITEALAQSRQFSSISDHALELFGLCRICSKEQGNSASAVSG